MAVLRDRAREARVSVPSSFYPSALLLLSSCLEQLLFLSQCPLQVCPDLDAYQNPGRPLRLGLAGQHQRSNASLAIQLSHAWLQRRCPPGGRTAGGVSSSVELEPQAAPLRTSPATVKGQSRSSSRAPSALWS